MPTAAAPREIDAVAVDWAVRLDAGNLSSDERNAFERWLGDDPRHRGALLRAEAGLHLLSAEAAPQPEKPTIVPAPPVPRPRRWMPALGAAASALAASIAMFWVLTPSAGSYRTAIGELRRVPLADGSTAMINTDSALRAEVADAPTRRIALTRGEAWFAVAKNPARPFIVDAGKIHVRATGTAFSVRRLGEAAQVVVTEGSVAAWIDGAENRRVAISAGQGATLGPAGSVVRKAAGADPLAWRSGELLLDDMTIAAAVDEMNRYNLRKIRLDNATLGRERMVGLFRVDRPDEFATAITRLNNAKVQQTGNEIVIK